MTPEWHDQFSNRAELADALAALGLNGVSQAIAALRRGERSDALADALEDVADTQAIRWGDYHAHGVIDAAAEALRPDAPEPIRPERYITYGLGHPFEPADSARVPYNDPDME